MPPKGSRGAGRGRGRGRGKAIASVPDPEPPAPQKEPEKTDSQGTDNTLSDDEVEAGPSAQAEAVPAPAANVTPTPQFQDAPSPNSSPATVPTETPAPTPAKAPAPILPPPKASASTRGRGGGRGGRGGEKAAAPSRFKPKITRRDEEERMELAKKEEHRLAGIKNEWDRQQERANRRGGARGRGDVMGSRGRVVPGKASGIFGVVPAGLGHAPGYTAPRSSGGGSSGGTGYGIRSGKGGGSSGSGFYTSGGGGSGGGGFAKREKGWVPTPEYPDEDEDVERVNIEEINMLQDEVIYTGTKAVRFEAGLLPVRLHREEHKERGAVKKDPDRDATKKEDEEDSPTIDELRSTQVKGKGKAVETAMDDDHVSIKSEEEEDDNQFPLAYAPATPAIKSSPDSKRKARLATVASMPQLPDVEDKPAAKGKKPAPQKAKKGREPNEINHLVVQTEEDDEENKRIQSDMFTLREELGNMQTVDKPPRFADAEGDIDLAGALPAPDKKNKEGRLYLFQFPPVLPALYDPERDMKPKSAGQIAREEEMKGMGKEKGSAIDLTGSTNAGKSKGNAKAAVDLTSDTKIKEEEEVEQKGDENKEEDNKRDEFVRREGFVGKMIVRKSGTVELDWGGTKFIVARGVETQFLTTSMIVDSVEKGPTVGVGPPEGKALSMGKIMGKFVVTPDWMGMSDS